MRRIAVIDNDSTLLSLSREIFAEREWETLPFLDGETALAALRDAPPDLVVLDVLLEGSQSGWTVLQQLKEDPATRHVPVILWSGAIDRLRDKADWLRDHGILSLDKPFEIDHLFALVDAALEGHDIPSPLATGPGYSPA